MTQAAQQADELKPCPFCGSGVVAHGLFEDNHMFVRCMDCDTCGPYILVPEHTMEMPKYIAQAYAAWNRRAPSTAPAGRVVPEEMIEAAIRATGEQSQWAHGYLAMRRLDPAFKALERDAGEVWSMLRRVLEQGAAIQQDYAAGKYASYEHYSARVDEAARERVPEFTVKLDAMSGRGP